VPVNFVIYHRSWTDIVPPFPFARFDLVVPHGVPPRDGEEDYASARSSLVSQFEREQPDACRLQRERAQAEEAERQAEITAAKARGDEPPRKLWAQNRWETVCRAAGWLAYGARATVPWEHEDSPIGKLFGGGPWRPPLGASKEDPPQPPTTAQVRSLVVRPVPTPPGGIITEFIATVDRPLVALGVLAMLNDDQAATIHSDAGVLPGRLGAARIDNKPLSVHRDVLRTVRAIDAWSRDPNDRLRGVTSDMVELASTVNGAIDLLQHEEDDALVSRLEPWRLEAWRSYGPDWASAVTETDAALEVTSEAGSADDALLRRWREKLRHADPDTFFDAWIAFLAEATERGLGPVAVHDFYHACEAAVGGAGLAFKDKCKTVRTRISRLAGAAGVSATPLAFDKHDVKRMRYCGSDAEQLERGRELLCGLGISVEKLISKHASREN